MKRIILSLTIVCLSWVLATAQSDEQKVINVVKKMFDSMRASDSTGLRSVFHPEVSLLRTFNDREGNPALVTDGNIGAFIKQVGNAPQGALDEKIWSYDVRIDQNLATVWTDFTFVYNGNVSHCGVNTFQLFRSLEGWKIISIVDTRHTSDCITDEEYATKSVDKLLTDWHQAATDADAKTYFGLMTNDSYFIGTDETERWNKEEFQAFAQKAFEKAPAWDFKKIERNIEMDEDKHTVWFDEKLDTWMGICRGSGVAKLTEDGWKIKHYVLSVTVPNEKIEEFKAITKKK